VTDTFVDRALRRDERLSQNLPAKNTLPAVFRALAHEQIPARSLKIQQSDKVFERRIAPFVRRRILGIRGFLVHVPLRLKPP
jgi:hypothetical protein